MNPDTLQDIYTAFTRKDLNSSDLLYALSRYDLDHEMTSDSFHKRIRVNRTIITELKRYLEQNGTCRDHAWSTLKELYIKDYLYFCAAQNKDYRSLDFTAYIQLLIDTHSILSKQYEHLENRDAFWQAVARLEEDMQNT